MDHLAHCQSPNCGHHCMCAKTSPEMSATPCCNCRKRPPAASQLAKALAQSKDEVTVDLQGKYSAGLDLNPLLVRRARCFDGFQLVLMSLPSAGLCQHNPPLPPHRGCPSDEAQPRQPRHLLGWIRVPGLCAEPARSGCTDIEYNLVSINRNLIFA